MRRSAAHWIGVVAALLALGGVGVARIDEVPWQGKLDEALLDWVEAGGDEQRAVFVHLLPGLLGVAPQEGTAYVTSSHTAWGRSDVSQALVQIADGGRIVFGLSLLREGSAIWERALPFCLEHGVVQVACDIVGARAIASMPEVERLSTDLAVMADGQRSAGEETDRGASPLLGPDALRPGAVVDAADLSQEAAARGWVLVPRGLFDRALSETLAGASAFRVVALGIDDAVAHSASAEALLGQGLAEASFHEVGSEPPNVEMLLRLAEGCAQTNAQLAAVAPTMVGEEVVSLYIFLRADDPDSGHGQDRPAPAVIVATKGSHEEWIEVLWDPMTGVDRFEILRNVDGGPYELLVVSGDSSYSDTDVETCRQYGYAVRSLGPDGIGGESCPLRGYVGNVPFPVEEVRAWEVEGGIWVEWTPSAGATHYRLLRSEPYDGVGPVTAKQYMLGLPEEPWFLDTDVCVGQIYQYRVFADNGCGRSGMSSAARASVFAALPPRGPDEPPYRVTASLGEPYGRVVVSWNPVPGAVSYRVLRATEYLGDYVPLTVVDGTTFEDFEAEHCVDYWYRIQTLGDGVESPVSASAHGIYGYRPLAPDGVRATQGAFPDAIRIDWQPVEDALYYSITRAPAQDGPYAPLVAGLPEPFFLDQGLEPGQEFWYRVRASNFCGCSGDRGEVCGATTPN